MVYNGHDEEWTWGSRVPPNMDTMKITTSEIRMVDYSWDGGQRPMIWGTALRFLVGLVSIDMKGNARHVQGGDQQSGVTDVRR